MSHRPDHGSGPSADEPFDRLRAADPAASAVPDHALLDAAVRARVGDVGLGAAARGSAAGPVAGARTRPRRWLAVAAVAAGTLVVGSAGYALGDRADGDLTAAPPSTAAIRLGAPGQTGSVAPQAAGEASIDARVGGQALPEDATSASTWFGGRTVFTAQGLSDDTGTAEAWAYDATRTFTADTAARVAASLGLEGEPRRELGSWVVGSPDGRSPSLQLYPDGTTGVSFYDPTRDPFGCPTPEPGIAEPGAAVAPVPEPVPDDAPRDGGVADLSAPVPVPDVPVCTTTDTGDAPQGDAAVARAREVLSGAGVDPDAFEYEVMDAGTARAVHVTAHELLGGRRTGLLWSMTLVGDGVQSLYGSLAPLVPLGTYDVISENAAVDRLADPRFGAWGGPVAIAAEDGVMRALPIDPVGPDEPTGSGDTEVPTPPQPVTAGSTFAWPVSEVVLTSARLGLAQHTQPDGAAVLLPAYELAADDGTTWSVVAVADAALDFAAGR